MKLKVGTHKMPCGDWSCYTTYKGIDKAFVGKDISVVIEMNDWLKNEPVDVVWETPEIHPPSQPKSRYKFKRPIVDKGMV